MIHCEFAAMGTRIEAWSEEARTCDLRAWFEEVEEACSRFRPGSELSRLNARQEAAVEVEGILGEVIAAASRARDITDGLVDIGVGAAVAAWGYDRTFESVTDLAMRPASVERRDWAIEGTLLTRDAGVSLDLGGIAKGWSCDRAVEDGLADVVSAGGDLRSSHPDTTSPIVDPDGRVVTAIHVGRAALATSSVGRRRWRVGGAEVSHLIDPRTMEPIDTPVVSASVLADTAVDAEAGAKAVLLKGVDGLHWAGEQDWIAAAVVIWHDGSVFGTPGLVVAA